ncbi:ArnT family glycosyltransferase [Anatilimnocola floriformis]|uniref:ArnT family glycosyltransferase n=1 Tax=Anatilimnocola floriformis TaxID=2948575 RepID=UPI0020C440E7|nr:hypothetical protein [Anatilimnocola floriformis]
MHRLATALQKHRGILLLLLFTLIVRGSVLIARFDELRADPDAYHLIAHNMVRFACFSIDDPADVAGRSGDPAPSAYRPPLYPVILSNLAIGKDQIIHYERIALLHLGLGLATVWVTWFIAHALQLGWASYLAGVLVACDPLLLNQQTLIMTETLAAFCTVVAWGLLVRFDFDRNWWNAALAGGAIGLAALCRPTYLPWMGISAVVAFCLQPGVVSRQKRTSRTTIASAQWGLRLLNAAALLVFGLGVMFPWAWRNYREFKKPILTTTHGGYTIYLANNRHFYKYLREDKTGLPWDPRQRTSWGPYRVSFRDERRGLISPTTGQMVNPPAIDGEIGLDIQQRELARQAMLDDPAGFLLAATYRVRQFWSPLPYRLTADESRSRTLLRYATAVWYLAVYALALVGVWQLRGKLLRSPWLFGIFLVAIFSGVHVFYWSNLRMRAPIMPIIAVIAAVGALRLRELRSHVPQVPNQDRAEVAGDHGKD